jgi:hypothetical protein
MRIFVVQQRYSQTIVYRVMAVNAEDAIGQVNGGQATVDYETNGDIEWTTAEPELENVTR